jgi:hypothetical protein
VQIVTEVSAPPFPQSGAERVLRWLGGKPVFPPSASPQVTQAGCGRPDRHSQTDSEGGTLPRPSSSRSESRNLVVTLRQSGSLRPDLTGSKSHTDLLSFGLQSDEGNRTLRPVSGLDHFLRELRPVLSGYSSILSATSSRPDAISRRSSGSALPTDLL